MLLTISVVNPRTAPEQSAYDRWMSQTADREQARIDRCAGGAVVQGMLMGSVTVVIALLCSCSRSSTTPTVTGWEDCGRRRWSGPFA
jgi:hypothetical protein